MATLAVGTTSPILQPPPNPTNQLDSESMPARAVVRCEYCRLMQYMTSNYLCRKCHRPLDIQEPPFLATAAATAATTTGVATPGSIDRTIGFTVATSLRNVRRAKHLSQEQLAGRMQVPRTYISKLENRMAVPTLHSLERLANALGVDVCQLFEDARSRRAEEVAALLADPFLAEVAASLPGLNALHRTIFFVTVKDAVAAEIRRAA